MSRALRTCRRLMFAGAMLLAVTICRADSNVPYPLQAQLVSKLGAFDRNLPARAAGKARVLVLQKVGDAESARGAENVAKALAAIGQVGGIAAQVDIEGYSGPASLAQRCREKKLAIVFFSTGLDAEMEGVGAALNGVDVLTVGATASNASRGTVVAFDLEEGRPKIVVNVARAKAQNVSFKAELLKLARIVG